MEIANRSGRSGSRKCPTRHTSERSLSRPGGESVDTPNVTASRSPRRSREGSGHLREPSLHTSASRFPNDPSIFHFPSPGTRVEVFSDTAGDWVSAKMVTVRSDGYGIVQYWLNGSKHQKALRQDTRRLRLPECGSASDSPRGSTSPRSASCGGKNKRVVNEHVDLIALLSNVSIFEGLPGREIRLLAAACSRREFDMGEVIVRQHDFADVFYVLAVGRVSVSVDGVTVATLDVGAYFGENALLQEDMPRCATVSAATSTSLFAITRDRFRQLGLDGKIDLPKRKAVGGGGSHPVAIKRPGFKTSEERKLMRQAVKANQNIQAMHDLDDTTCDQIIDAAWKEEISAGCDVIKEGDLDGHYFYIVQDGKFAISVMNPSAHLLGTAGALGVSRGNVVQTVEAGGSFGELALLYLAPRAATVTALTKAIVWVIDRNTFKRILVTSNDDKVKQHMRLLDCGSPFFAQMDLREVEAFANALSEVTFQRGDSIFEEKEEPALYVLYEGKAEVCTRSGSLRSISGSTEEPEMLGLQELLKDQLWGMTMTVVSDKARCLHMEKAKFDVLAGVNRSSCGDSGSTSVRRSSSGAVPSITRHSARGTRIRRDQLEPLGLLGCGGFGAVIMVQHRHTKAVYALKALSKGYIVKTGMQSSVQNEKSIQLMCNSPFIIKLYETYNHDQSLFFLLEVAPGGELYRTYRRNGLYGSETHARFYLAGVVFAFEHLHEKMVIHRDLKPENLLLSIEGKIKLADMGLAKLTVGKTYTTCGTPVYFAPEMIDSSAGHSKGVDWWTFGVLTFELMCGRTPFEGDTPSRTYAAVRKGIDNVTFPKKMNLCCVDFVRAICKRDPSERLPMRKRGDENVKEHRWYHGFDWRAMSELTLKPPYMPPVSCATDKAIFSAKEDTRPPQILYTDDGSGWDKDFATSV
eukprot:TRINITY_DN11888_c0_g1_i1.p1 TRINITY_DN11888_c0_g1~~TRINITY_DN11888_c0_g1_i1.p1  ORF type:complete len:919 (-),score=124.29 TRINITY_DN11888_c0_g1_i1:330-3086(-)